MNYDPDNTFAKILRGEVPAHKVYEDEHTLAFMDVFPQTDGHILVIPKAASRNLFDAHPRTLGPLMATVQKLAQAARKAFDADGVLVQQFNEPAAGQTVFYLHMHILPRRDSQALRAHSGKMADHALLAKHAEMVKAALSN